MYLAHPSGLKAHTVATQAHSKPRLRLPWCVQAGANLFRDGDRCAGLFEILSGTVRLSRLTRDGRRSVIGFGFPGDILGFGPEGHHIADCDAISDARVIRHRPEGLHGIGADPDQQRALLNGALRQIAGMQDHCMMLGRLPARDRVAAFLSQLGDRLGVPLGRYLAFDLPMSRADIADYLGLTNETVSRSLTELRNARLIAIENLHHFMLLSPQHLTAQAEGEA